MATKRPWSRAKIFQPFDALPGLRELLRQKEIEHEVRFDAEGNEAGIQHEPEARCLQDMDEDGRMKSNDSTNEMEMSLLEFQVNEEHVFLLGEQGNLLANADFRETSPGVFDIYHTVVLPELRGQGIASKLVAKTVDEIHRRGGTVTASCTYAKAWLERHKG